MHSLQILVPVLTLLATAQAAPSKQKRCKEHNGGTTSSVAHSSSSETVAISTASGVYINRPWPFKHHTTTSTAEAVTTTSVVKAVTPTTTVKTTSSSTHTTSSSTQTSSSSTHTSSTSPVPATTVKMTTATTPTSVKPTTTSSATSVTSTAKAITTVSTTSTSVAAAPTTGSGSGAKGVGLAVNNNSGKLSSFTSATVPGSKLAWYYDWDYNAFSDSAGIEYTPMVWGTGSVNGVAAAEKNWKGVTSVLGFNEPDIGASSGGSSIDPTTAATLHQQWTKSLQGTYRIGSPAVARGGQNWLSQWITACNGKCEYDFTPLHFYGTNAQDLITYVQSFHAQFGKPIWITEMACQDYSNGQVCTQAQAEAFITTVVDFFRSTSYVERWSWFGFFTDDASGGNGNGAENSDGSANALGKLFLTS